MDIKTMFPNLSLMWVRWSEYEIIRQTDNGIEKEYIVPVPGAEQITFDCTERTGAMIESAILIGEAIVKENMPTVPINSLCANFASQFGLLGQMVGTDPASMAIHNNMAPIHYPLNSERYGEELSYFQECFVNLYRHFTSTYGYYPRGPKTGLGLYGTLNYRVTQGRTPQIIWGVDSLEAVLRLAYASLITSEKPALKVCKNCGKIYYNSHAKSEFCGAKCRNQYNVKMFRLREKKNSQNN